MKIAILIGSSRAGRQSHQVAYYLKKQLDSRAIKNTVIDLAKEPLPVYDTATKVDDQVTDNVQAIGAKLKESDGLLLVTPEYHGSFSGVLKNALDYYWEEFQRKPIGVVAASSGKMGGINASVQLQHVVLSLGAFALPLKLLVPEIQNAFDENLEPREEKLVKSANKFLDEYLWLADAVFQKKIQKLEKVF